MYYWLLEEKVEVIKDKIILKIINVVGDIIWIFKYKGKFGLNRIWWDLKDDFIIEIVLCMKLEYVLWIELSEKRIWKLLNLLFLNLVLFGIY